MKNLLIHLRECDSLANMLMVEALPTSWQPLKLVRRKASATRTWEDFSALGAIGGDDERKRENEEMREF